MTEEIRKRLEKQKGELRGERAVAYLDTAFTTPEKRAYLHSEISNLDYRIENLEKALALSNEDIIVYDRLMNERDNLFFTRKHSNKNYHENGKRIDEINIELIQLLEKL